MNNAVSWFEIPTTNIERAERFYTAMLGKPMRREMAGDKPMSIFPHDEKAVGGCLIQDKTRKPASEGALVYFFLEDLDGALARTPAAGGAVVLARTSIGEHGFIATVRDTEGNVVGLHAMK